MLQKLAAYIKDKAFLENFLTDNKTNKNALSLYQ